MLKHEDFLVEQLNNDLSKTSGTPTFEDKLHEIYNLNILAYVNVCLNNRNNFVSSCTKQKLSFFYYFYL